MNEQTDTHFVGKVAQKVIIVKGDSVLITRDSRDTIWELPGGRLDANENPEAGIKREVLEELGVTIEVGQIIYVNQFVHSKDGSKAVVLVYQARLVDEAAEFTVDPVEVAQMQWVNSATWEEYEFYPEYRMALKKHFSSL